MCGQAWDGREFPGKRLLFLPPQPGGNMSELPKERSGSCKKRNETVPQLLLYPADKTTLIPHLFLNNGCVYTDVTGMIGSTCRHASTYMYLLSTYINIYTRTYVHALYVFMQVCTDYLLLKVVGVPLQVHTVHTRSTGGNVLGARCTCS